MSENILPVFFSRSFKGSCLQFKSFSHFYFNSVNGERECTNFIDLHAPWPTLTSKMIFRYSFEYQKNYSGSQNPKVELCFLCPINICLLH